MGFSRSQIICYTKILCFIGENHMKAAVVKSNSIIEIITMEKPPLGSYDILVKMQAWGFVAQMLKKYLENMVSLL